VKHIVIRVCVIVGYGINADCELAEAFEQVGARAQQVHMSDLVETPDTLQEFSVLAFPGGFSFGDHLGSGKVFAALFKRHLRQAVDRFVAAGGLVIGICNGFQVLVKMGVLPNLDGTWEPTASLVYNDAGVFEDSWVRVRFHAECTCVWTRGLTEMDLPIRNGEGRFVVRDDTVRRSLQERHLVALQYAERNPNGSVLDIAGITDTTGRILGLMPHPEAFRYPENHPHWSRRHVAQADGLRLLENGVRWAASHGPATRG
jgi:phosphoribosylformylglycinamidine synthase subunit PurQ / glutaminase